MPTSSFDLKTEVDYDANVLIVDELGEISTLLVDALLNHGCLIHYLGSEPRENFNYLSRKNFNFLNSISEVEKIKNINYLFYLSAENAPKVMGEGDLTSLAENFFCKTIVISPWSSPVRERYQNVLEEGKLNLRLLFFDCLFGPRIRKGILGRLFQAGVWGQEGMIPERSEKKVFPLFAGHLTREAIRLIFAADTKGKTFFLESEEISLGDFVLRMKKHCPNLGIGLVGKEAEEKIDMDKVQKIKVGGNLEEEIESTVEWFERNQPAEKPEEEEKPADNVPHFETEVGVETMTEKVKESEEEKPIKIKKNASWPRRIAFGAAFFFLLLFLFFIFPLVLSGAVGMLAIREMKGTEEAAKAGRLSSAVQRNNRSLRLLAVSQKMILTCGPFYSLIGLDKEVGLINETFLFSQKINESLKYALLAGRDFSDWAKDFINGGGGNKEETLASIKVNLASAYEEASLAQLSWTKLEGGYKPLGEMPIFENFRKILPSLREGSLKGENLLGVFPSVLGYSGRKTYLVLFENNAELRPTGGFIGSFALINLENGKLVNFEVFDVYQADGQLKGHVEPPAKLKEYLGEASWYLRDSNWDPDFRISAQRAQWFLDKEMQVPVDGTIAVTLEAVRKLVAAVGKVVVPEYQETIDQDNLFQKAEYHAEMATFPGSTQKKDFLASLAQALFEKIKNSQGQELVGLAGALYESLEEKEIMLYFNDSQVELVVNNLNWGGRIRAYQPISGGQPIYADYLFINEANVGVNKANFFVQRKIDHQITLKQDGKIEEKLTLTYDNQSPSGNWPAGNYKNYLRLYLPKETKVTSALITDPQNPGLWVPFDWHFFDSGEDHEKSFFGFLLEVPIKTKTQIQIDYELDAKADLSKRLNSYLLLLQKQAGAYPSAYSLSFIYPQGMAPVRVIPSAIVGNGQLLVNQKLDRDLIFQIDLAH